MAVTKIPAGHPMARKVFGAAVFAEYIKQPGFSQRLTGPAPKMSQAAQKLERMQTSRDYPCVRITDLRKGAGDTVTVDLFNILHGKPVMGDERLVGKGMKIESATMELKINQMRAMVETGGRMTRQRTVHNLRTVGVANLAGWFARAFDQIKLVHLAGARGDENTPDWVVPPADDPDFAPILVNPIWAPTFNRHLYAGQKTDIENLTTADYLTLDDLDRLNAIVMDSYVQLQPIRLPDDPSAADSPLFILWVTHRQWHWLQTQTTTNNAPSWRTFLMNAGQRGSSNPLFKGDAGMWGNILVKKLPRAIRFHQGSTVTVATSAASYTETTKTVPTFDGADTDSWHSVDRAILVGAQAVAEAFGRHHQSGMPMSWHEELVDHENEMEISGASMGGVSKLRFKDKNGTDYDHGVWVIDSYAPDPQFASVASGGGS